jgi:diguanylate cyclase (GGDEF)-like protein
MNLDVNTLFLVTIYVEAILGLLLLFAWVQNPNIRAVAWWGFAHLLRALSVMLFGMYGSVPDFVSIDFANVVLFTSFVITWTGARVFDGRSPMPLGMVAGAALWLVVCRLPVFTEMADVRFLLASGIITTYTWLAAYEFWRGRDEPLVSRWPAIFMLFAHGALFLLRTPVGAALPWAPGTQQVQGSVWLTVLSFEALLFTIAIAFILLAMAKERTEHRHKTAALIDPLTGIANRRAFLQEATELVKRANVESKPAAVVLMDLDHFKSINDRFGHGVGDQVLQIFADIARDTIRAMDIVGRLGGEEFAVVLPNVGREKALVIAERLRAGFAEAAANVNGREVGATVSMGVVMTGDGPPDVGILLAQADHALYSAKERGRNRVELASLELIKSRAVGQVEKKTAGQLAQAAASTAA